MTGDVWTFSSRQADHSRSAAVANIGLILAKSGARVLLVDWDFDTRILHTFFEDLLDEQLLTGSLGLVGLLSKARAGVDAEHSGSNPPKLLRDLSVANQTVRIDGPFQPGGALDLLPAGREHPWISQPVAATDWDRLLAHRDDIKAKIGALSAELRRDYDYVLINQGSGSDGATQISTRMNPCAMVTYFALTEQAINLASEAVGKIAPPHVPPHGLLRILPVPVRLRNTPEETRAGREHARKVFRNLPTGLSDDLRGRYWEEVEIQERRPFKNGDSLVVFDRNQTWQMAQARAYGRLVLVLTKGLISSPPSPPRRHLHDGATVRRLARAHNA